MLTRALKGSACKPPRSLGTAPCLPAPRRRCAVDWLKGLARSGFAIVTVNAKEMVVDYYTVDVSPGLGFAPPPPRRPRRAQLMLCCIAQGHYWVWPGPTCLAGVCVKDSFTAMASVLHAQPSSSMPSSAWSSCPEERSQRALPCDHQEGSAPCLAVLSGGPAPGQAEEHGVMALLHC